MADEQLTTEEALRRAEARRIAVEGRPGTVIPDIAGLAGAARAPIPKEPSPAMHPEDTLPPRPVAEVPLRDENDWELPRRAAAQQPTPPAYPPTSLTSLTSKEALRRAWARRSTDEGRPGVTKNFFAGANVGIAKALGIPVDAVNAMMMMVGLGAEAPLGGSESIMRGMESGLALDEGVRDAPDGFAGQMGEFVGGATASLPMLLGSSITTAGRIGPDAAKKFLSTIPHDKAAGFLQLLKATGLDIADSAIRSPKSFLLAEVLAATGGGIAVEDAERLEMGPTGQTIAGIIGGGPQIAVSLGLRNQTSRFAQWGMENALPFTKAGAFSRASRQMQARSADPAAARQAAAGAPEGVTPARSSGEDSLMAQEARILADDPVLAKQVEEDLVESIRRTQRDLNSYYDTPEGKQDWELSVIERVTPEGTTIRSGSAEDMIDQAYDGFEPLYAEVKGIPIYLRMLLPGRRTSLETMLANVPNTRTIAAGERERNIVGNWLDNAFTSLSRSTTVGDRGPWVDSADLLQLRSRIRSKARKMPVTTPEGIAMKEFYELAVDRINSVLKSQLSTSAMTRLGSIDAQYAAYKTVEGAIYNSADRGLTPNGLLRAVRQSASSRGAYARGEGTDMRQLAQDGRTAQEVWNKPDMATRYVRDMDDVPKQNLQNRFVREMMRKSAHPELSDEGFEVTSGPRLLQLLREQGPTLRALDMGPEDINRIATIARELTMMQAKTPAALEQLMEDGPATIMQLVATIIGARQGQKFSDQGMGAGMVLAGFFSKQARQRLEHITNDNARRIMTDAATDRKLFESLMTTPNDSAPIQLKAARQIMSWIIPASQQVDNSSVDEESADTGIEALKRQAEALGGG